MQNLIKKNLDKRYKKEALFKKMGIFSISFCILFLAIFLGTIVFKGHKAFFVNKIALEVDFSEESLRESSNKKENIGNLSFEEIANDLSFVKLVRKSIRDKFSEYKDPQIINSAYKIVSDIADYRVQKNFEENPQFINSKQLIWVEVSSKVDVYLKYNISTNLKSEEVAIINSLVQKGEIKSFFNYGFFTSSDSREPEIAGISASLKGSFYTMIIFLIFAFPIGVASAFYLEEIAKKSKINDLIEVSINNLAAIPSIIYGLLGLTVYLQFMNLPRSSSIVGGMTLAMLVLPVIIIATRNTIRSIPHSIKDAAMALGASKMQIIIHHLFPLSIPGIMTGTILAVSRALGETAPLLMIGMVAFIADSPQNFYEPSTVLPVQIFLWSDSPEIGFAEKTSAAILVLLTFLIAFNLFAIILRKKFERKW